jgi:hypothetical protein
MGRDERRREDRRSIASTCLALLVGFGAMVSITLAAPLVAQAYPPTTPPPTTTIVDIGGPTTTTSTPSTTVVRPTTTNVQSGGPTTTRPGDIPTMGANSIDLVQVAVVALVAGLSLLGVAALRRRPPAR